MCSCQKVMLFSHCSAAPHTQRPGAGPAYPSESSARSSARSRSLSMMTSLRATCGGTNTNAHTHRGLASRESRVIWIHKPLEDLVYKYDDPLSCGLERSCSPPGEPMGGDQRLLPRKTRMVRYEWAGSLMLSLYNYIAAKPKCGRRENYEIHNLKK